MLWGTFIYAFLGQDHQVDLWMDGCGARGGKDPRWHDQRWASHHLGSCSLLISVCKVPRLQNVRLRKILILEKCLVLFDPYRSLKVKKNTQSRDFLFFRVITKIRKIIGKSPKNIKHKYNFI
jgi:hypothetical protein